MSPDSPHTFWVKESKGSAEVMEIKISNWLYSFQHECNGEFAQTYNAVNETLYFQSVCLNTQGMSRIM